MSREEFNTIIRESFLKYKEYMLWKDKNYLFNESYSIAKQVSIYNFLVGDEDWIVEPLYPYADETLFDRIIDFEFEYDVPMWSSWDDLERLVADYVEEMAKNK